MTREEAIRRVKAWNLDSDDREVLEVIIPELHESDDERIRKALIEVLHRLPASTFDYGAEGGYLGATKEQMLAYLEKQKQQKPAEPSSKPFRIVINCDGGFVADTLREIATRYENAVQDLGEYAQFGFYEAEHGVGTIEETEL